MFSLLYKSIGILYYKMLVLWAFSHQNHDIYFNLQYKEKLDLYSSSPCTRQSRKETFLQSVLSIMQRWLALMALSRICYTLYWTICFDHLSCVIWTKLKQIVTLWQLFTRKNDIDSFFVLDKFGETVCLNLDV